METVFIKYVACNRLESKVILSLSEIIGQHETDYGQKESSHGKYFCIDDIFVVLYTYEELIMNLLISS